MFSLPPGAGLVTDTLLCASVFLPVEEAAALCYSCGRRASRVRSRRCSCHETRRFVVSDWARCTPGLPVAIPGIARWLNWPNLARILCFQLIVLPLVENVSDG